MPFLRSFHINSSKTQPFPFNIPAVKFAKDISIENGITIFVGDNGCGKSTLLESIALHCNLPLIGGFISNNPGFEAARLLQPFVELKWQRQTKNGFFFRAEDFSDFIDGVEKEKMKINLDLYDLKGQVDDDIIKRMAEGMNHSLREMRKNYGDNMQAYSHGEAYIKILQMRIGDKGIYLLDEPEAALSPLKQLSLMSLILELLKGKNAQFILATHSPILMGLPGAALYQVTDDGMEQVDFKETDHYRITKTFLDDPGYYLRYL
ncbi:MAG TPA: AAA family ATPase [Ferruginibacter sp.]|nr:AAA family ATPase [Ferruginibacter sp.]